LNPRSEIHGHEPQPPPWTALQQLQTLHIDPDGLPSKPICLKIPLCFPQETCYALLRYWGFPTQCEAASDINAPFDLVRALSNLSSFVREDSLLFTCQELGAAVSRPPLGANLLSHADLYLKIRGTTYNIWSPIYTPKARQSVVHKIFSQGNHLQELDVLAPINLVTNVQIILGRKIPAFTYASRMIDASDTYRSLDLRSTLILVRLGLREDAGFVVLKRHSELSQESIRALNRIWRLRRILSPALGCNST
jgi:hypothetical protein